MRDELPAERRPAIRLNQDRGAPRAFGSVELHGLFEEELARLRALPEPALRERFPVTVAPAPGRTPESVSPMLGEYAVEAQLVRFTPRFPLLAGQRVLARYDGAQAVLALAPPARPPAAVAQVYPSAEVLPENLLRWHIRFTAPMRAGEALRHIHLLGENGEPLSGVFLDPKEELWDKAGTRLTLLFDPGRVKTGLAAHEQLGRALCVGKRYRLVVDRAYPDMYGAPLAAEFSKTFLVAAAAGDALDARAFRLVAPVAGGREPLRVYFPRPVDAVQAALFLHVRGPAGPVRGAAELTSAETDFRFVPDDSWRVGEYFLEIDSRLEDLAGNNLAGPFDAAPQERRPPSILKLPFSVR